jgi:hypothetical protein
MTETTSVVMKTRLGNEMVLYSAFSRKMTMRVTITNLQTKSYDFVWPHGPLLDYEVRNGKPVVLVPWHPTWEPPDEYSKEEVERVKRQHESRTQCRGRGRPLLKAIVGKS